MSEASVIEWIRKHAPLERLCERGGWPDNIHIKVEIRAKHSSHWIVDIESTENSMEISECDVTVSPRCGEFRVAFDAHGKPVKIEMIDRLWTVGDALL